MPEQVDTDAKKKASFMRGLSTKLKERLSLNTSGTFPEFLSNAIIADNAIHAHKEGKKRKDMAAPFGNALPKYRVVHPFRPTNPPRKHQHQHWTPHPAQQQQWAFRLHPCLHQRPYHHHRRCYACLHHRLLQPPLALSASTVVVLGILPKTTLLQRRTQLRATSTIHPVANRRLLLPGLACELHYHGGYSRG
jgi:hypothetical protein